MKVYTPVPPEPTKRCYDTTELKDLKTTKGLFQMNYVPVEVRK